MRPRVRPLKPRATQTGWSPLAKWIAGGGAVAAVGLAIVIGLAVAPVTQGGTPTAKTTPPAATAIAPVTKAVSGPLGVHEPVEAGKAATAKAVSAFTYNTDPPTSGVFTSNWPKAYVLTSPMAKGALVHLESAGDVVIAYNGVPSKALATIKTFAQNIDTSKTALTKRAAAGEGVFVTPWPSVQKGHAVLLAWTRELDLKGWNASLASKFTNAYLGNKANYSQK